MESGAAAGAESVVGVASGAHTKDELIKAGATDVLAFATDLLTLINH